MHYTSAGIVEIDYARRNPFSASTSPSFGSCSLQTVGFLLVSMLFVCTPPILRLPADLPCTEADLRDSDLFLLWVALVDCLVVGFEFNFGKLPTMERMVPRKCSKLIYKAH